MSLVDLFMKRPSAEEKKKNEIRQAMIDSAEKAAAEGRFSLFMLKEMKDIIKLKDISLDALETFYGIGIDNDKTLNIPLNFGLFLDEISRDPTVVVGVNRSTIYYEEKVNGIPLSKALDDMMRNGFKNYGHINAVGGGAVTDVPDPSLCFTPLKGITGFVNLAAPYHHNNVIVFAGFPSDVVDEDLWIIDKNRADEIYDLTDRTVPIVKPEYLMAVVVKNENGLDDVFTRDEVLSIGISK